MLRLWLLVNMAGNRAEAEQILDRITTLSERFLSMEVQRAGTILTDPRVPHAVRRRVPFSLAYPSCQAAVSIREVARTLGLEDPSKGVGEGFFRRMTALLRGHLGVTVGDKN